jgi:hypothetical protein
MDAKRKDIIAAGGDPSVLVRLSCDHVSGDQRPRCQYHDAYCHCHPQDPKPFSLAFAMTHGIQEEEQVVVKEPPLPRYLRYLKDVVPPADSKWGHKLRQMDDDDQDDKMFLSPAHMVSPPPASEATPVETLPVSSPQQAGLSVSTSAATLMAFSKFKGSQNLKNASGSARMDSPSGDFSLPHTPTASHRSGARRDTSGTPTSRTSEQQDVASPTELVLAKRREKFNYTSNVASPITKADFARAMGPIQVICV